MEAMALRRPVISTFIAGIPELVRDGENGWLVPSGDVDALVGALKTCLAAPSDVLQRMSDAAFERVRRFHNLQLESKRLAQLIYADEAALENTATDRQELSNKIGVAVPPATALSRRQSSRQSVTDRSKGSNSVYVRQDPRRF
jgi:hypothetical protein